jgi:predicted phage terminase large subunit-like protein
MTKWSTVDIGGRIDASEDAENWLTIIYEAKDLLTGKMLCPKILNEETYDTLRKLQSPDIFMANYHQKPINIEGRMYKNIKIWSKDEITFDIDAPYIERRMIIDPSDGTGNDYFCAISFAIYKREAYIFDVLYVNEAAKCTPYIIAKRIITNRVKHCKIEANRGRLLIQTIKDRLKEMSHSVTRIEDFVSVDNKKVRISSCAWAVQETIYFPKGWSTKYPKFYIEIYDYQETGKNAHDDGAEVLSWISEDLNSIGKGSERAVFPINIPKKEKKELFYGYR